MLVPSILYRRALITDRYPAGFWNRNSSATCYAVINAECSYLRDSSFANRIFASLDCPAQPPQNEYGSIVESSWVFADAL